MRFYLDSDIVAGGINEDGERCHYHVYYIVCELADGSRFMAPGTTTDRRAMERDLKSIENACNSESLNLEGWDSIQPAYGSEAYAKDWNRWEFEAMDDMEQAEYLRRNGKAPY